MALPMYFISLTGLNNTDYSDSVKYVFGFTSKRILLHFVSGSYPIYFSLNGKDDHGVLGTTGYSVDVDLDVPTNEIWLRNGHGTEAVTITALPRD